MPGGNKNIRPEDNTNGFQKNPQNINKNGRPYSIDKRIKELLTKEGEYIIKKGSILEILDNGDIKVILPTSEQISMLLFNIAIKGKNDSLKAIQMIIERMDGKPLQKVEQENINKPGLTINVETQEQADNLKDVLDGNS